MECIDVILKDSQISSTVRLINASYSRISAASYKDKSAQLTARQAEFYRNLIAMALSKGSAQLPVDFIAGDGRRYYLDRGCIKIAEHAGFIEPLVNDSSGVVSSISLSWNVNGQSRLPALSADA